MRRTNEIISGGALEENASHSDDPVSSSTLRIARKYNAPPVAIGVSAIVGLSATILSGCTPTAQVEQQEPTDNEQSPEAENEQSQSELSNELALQTALKNLNATHTEVSNYSADILGGGGTDAQSQSIHGYCAALQDANKQINDAESEISASIENTPEGEVPPTYNVDNMDKLKQKRDEILLNVNLALEELNTELIGADGKWNGDRAAEDSNFLSQLTSAPDFSSGSQIYWNYGDATAARILPDANGNGKKYSTNLPKGAENANVQGSPFQSEWKDDPYGVKNDAKYDLSNVPGTTIDLGTIEVEGIGEVKAQSFVFDTDDTIQPEAVVSNIKAVGPFSRFVGYDMANDITPTDWLSVIWSKSPDDIYADRAGGKRFNVNFYSESDGNYYEYSKLEHNNTEMDRSVYSGDYSNAEKGFPVCFGGAFFKISENKAILLKAEKRFKVGFDPNSKDSRVKLNETFDNITPLQIDISGDNIVTAIK